MEIIASNSKQDVAYRRAVAEVQAALRELAANLLRITRGAGKPDELEKQAAQFLVASMHLTETRRAVSLDRIYSEALAWRKQRGSGEGTPLIGAEDQAIDTALSAAMQIIASRLIQQRPQEASGDNELQDGLRAVEKAREAWRHELGEWFHGQRGTAPEPSEPRD